MAAANSAIQVTELDFNNIRTSLSTFLSSQNAFKDYDFEGSNMSVLLDLLAYNTHYNSYYLNMVANEMFLDSAQLRNSVVSKAKALGYTPRSSRGAHAVVDLELFPGDSPVSISVGEDTVFTTIINDKTLTFTPIAPYVIVPDSNGLWKTSIELVEGFPLVHKYTVDTASSTSYSIPNLNVDTSVLKVFVRDDANSSVLTEYTVVTDITLLNGTSKVYFLEEGDDGLYQIYFGDNIIGQSPVDGNVVEIGYSVCNTTEGNGTSSFTLATDISGYTSSVTTTTVGFGGTEQESIDSVKFNAPKHFITQNRTVSSVDYERIILSENADFDAVNVWGGESNVPPVYGKVYISVKPTDGNVLSDTRKTVLLSGLSSSNVLSITPEIVDASYMFIVPTIEVTFNPDKTTKSASDIQTEVLTSVTSYESVNLNSFGKKFRFSEFLQQIDNTDTSILSNTTSINLQRIMNSDITISQDYVADFYTEINSDTLTSNTWTTKFTYNAFTDCYFTDSGTGTLDIVRLSGGGVVTIASNQGTIDYANGTVTLTSFQPDSLNDGVLKIYVRPTLNDVTPVRDIIIQFAETTVTTVLDREL